MKLLFYDGFDKCSKCIYLIGIELLELIGKSIHSIGRFLTEIEDCIEDAKKGLLSPYWQGYAEREVDSLRLTDGSLPERAEQLYKELKTILHEVHQITDD